MTNPVAEKFTEFYESWVCKLEENLNYLLREVTKQRNGVVTSDQDLQELVSQVTSQIKEYYSVKWDAAQEDVLIFFSSVWLSPLENVNQWITGFKPSTAFTLLDTLKKHRNGSSNRFDFDLTEEQEVKIEQLRMRIKMEEGKVEMDMERQQVAMADRKMVEVAKKASRAMKNMDESASNLVEQEVGAMNDVFGGLFKVLKSSDSVRLKTLKGVVDLLTPKQSVLFLAAHIATQLRLRQLGNTIEIGASAALVNDDNCK